MLEINLDTKQFECSLGQLLKNARNTKPMMRGIAAELVSLTEENFEQESWGGEKWKRSLRANNENGKTLQKSGQLAASISTQVSNTFARIGSNKPYAAIHHMGGKAGRHKSVTLPARPYLPISKNGKLQPRAEERLLEIALDALKKGVGK